jgi:hypothetical protein
MPSASSPLNLRASSSKHNGRIESLSSADNASGPESISDSKDGTSALSSAEESPEELSSDEEQRKRAYKADITPHHRAEKRPQRRSAAKASDAWSQLGPGRKNNVIVEVVIDTPSRRSNSNTSSARSHSQTSRHISDVGVVVSTPTKRTVAKEAVSTSKGKERAIDNGVIDAAIRTPSKKTKVVTPRKKPAPVTPTTATLKARALARRDEELGERYFIRPTSSDAYFANHAPRSKRNSSKHQTSDNVISGSMPSISSKLVAKLSADIKSQLQGEEEARNLLQAGYFEPYYDYWWSLLECTNRPLIMYGIGSKKAQLQDFARHLGKQSRCASIVVRGESGGRIEDVIRELERCISVSASAEQKRLYSTPLEARAHTIVQALDEGKGANVAPSFFILIHNFDSPLLMQERSLHTLGILSASERIHLCVDTCHVNSGLVGQMHSDAEQSTLPWLWINLNTFVPMLDEIINERGIGISRAIGLPRVLDIRAAGGEVIGSDEDVTMMAEDDYDRDTSAILLSKRAAIQILRSVPTKGRNLFLLLAEDFLRINDETNNQVFGLCSTWLKSLSQR